MNKVHFSKNSRRDLEFDTQSAKPSSEGAWTDEIEGEWVSVIGIGNQKNTPVVGAHNGPFWNPSGDLETLITNIRQLHFTDNVLCPRNDWLRCGMISRASTTCTKKRARL